VRGDVRDREVLERTIGEMRPGRHSPGGADHRGDRETGIGVDVESNISGTWNVWRRAAVAWLDEVVVWRARTKRTGIRMSCLRTREQPLEGRHPLRCEQEAASDLIAQALCQRRYALRGGDALRELYGGAI